MSRDPQAVQELVRDWNSRGTPTLVVDGQVVIGFDRARIDALLAG